MNLVRSGFGRIKRFIIPFFHDFMMVIKGFLNPTDAPGVGSWWRVFFATLLIEGLVPLHHSTCMTCP